MLHYILVGEAGRYHRSTGHTDVTLRDPSIQSNGLRTFGHHVGTGEAASVQIGYVNLGTFFNY
jgi:hypothetical protein